MSERIMSSFRFLAISLLMVFTVAVAQEREPQTSDDYVNRGNARIAKGQYENAIADFAKAIELNPISAPAYYGRGLVRYVTGDREGGIADETKAIELNPNYSEAFVTRGNI